MPADTKMIPILSLIASLFVRLDEESYNELYRSAGGKQMSAPVSLRLQSEAGCEGAPSLLLPSWPVRVSLQNEVLTAGMPLAALPVESLYKPWSTVSGSAYGAQWGLYLGDAARHVQSLYASLELRIPEGFEAMPDHLALLIDLLCLFLENGNQQAARDLVADHFDWLGRYGAALACRADEVAQAPAFDEVRRAALLEGLEHLRALVQLVGQLVCRCGDEETSELSEEGSAACLSA